MSHERRTVGNRDPSYQDAVAIGGVAQNLTGKTVKFKMRLAKSGTLKVDAAATVVTPASGIVRYDFLSADVDTPGIYVFWWEVTTTSTGRTQDTPEQIIEFVEHAISAIDLCTLADVRIIQKKEGREQGENSVMESFITAASRAILNYTGREFAPATTSPVTRRFVVNPDRRFENAYLVEFGRYDLRSVTSASLHPETASPTTLTNFEDYVLEPAGAPQGTYTELRLYGASNLSSDVYRRFGHAYLDINGQWGFNPIPEDVAHWCAMQVNLWMRRDVQAFSTTFSLEEERLERPEALASAVRSGLSHYRRPVLA